MHINELDCIILLLIFVSAMIGVLRGFVKETLQLVSLLVAGFSAFFLRKHVTFLFSFIESNFVKEILSAIGIFILLFIIGSIVVYLICQTISMQGFGKFIDRLLGLSYGCIRGGLIIMLTIVLLEKNDSIASHDWWKNSKLLDKIQQTSITLSKSIPIDWKEKINQLAE